MPVALIRGLLSAEALIQRAALVASSAALVIAAIAGFYQVWTRFVIHDSSAWTEVTTRMMLIWMVFLAIGSVFRIGAEISIDVLRDALPITLRGALDAIISGVTLLVLAVLVVYGIDLTHRVRFQVLAGLDISIAWAYAAIPIGSLIGILSVIATAIERRFLPPPRDDGLPL